MLVYIFVPELKWAAPSSFAEDHVPDVAEVQGPAPTPGMMCRGAPLQVAPAYQEMVDMGFISAEEAGVPVPGQPDDFDVIIPYGTNPLRIAFEVSSLQELAALA